MYGLSSKKAEKLQKQYGFNEISVKNKKKIWNIFLGQYTNAFSIVLIIASLLSIILTLLGYSNDYIDFFLIVGILFFNGILGTIQEYKAEKTLEALKKLQKTFVKVYRDNKVIELDSKFLVPGDIVILQEGDKITFDGNILEGNLTIDESSFTGESFSVHKKQKDIVYSGTFVVGGDAKVKVEKTGLKTKFGKLTVQVQDIEDISFFKNQLNFFTKKLMKYIFIILIIFFAVAFFREGKFITILLASVALGVAIVPEGLAVTTVITMMNGIKKLVEKKVIVKKIDAVEVLGAIDYIVSDKTGTLTKGSVKVYGIKGQGKLQSKLPYFAIPNSNDPLENALINYSNENNLKTSGKLEKIISFDYDSRTSSTIWNLKNKKVQFIKGAPEQIFKMTNKAIDISRYLDNGLRVLAFAEKQGNKTELLGIIAFEDPIREEVKKATINIQKAGVNLIMVTGDHQKTALFVANQLNINKSFLSGEELQAMSKKEVFEKLKYGGVVYRALPETKMYLVESLQHKGKIVATTGDGVNDVLLLKKADVGLAMGEKGTDVAKEAADIILLDDSFKTITDGILEGRNIIVNVRKFLTFLLTCNVGEAISNLIFPFLYFKIPLDAPKLLWINLITDGFPAVSFSFDEHSDDLLKRRPEDFRVLLTTPMKKLFLYSGLTHGLFLAGIFALTLYLYGFIVASTIVFSGIIFSELARVFAVRILFKDNFKKALKNKIMNYSLIISFLLQFVVVYIFYNLFKIAPLSFIQMMFAIGWGIMALFIGVFFALKINSKTL